ncbi:amino acid permease [Fodinibius saliphilus]|uniref:amino acid permease n=1 Tax=Fodinibius saliphilus TaxID=1920650 RepID=UPI001107FE06|nr:amino acid permease [Fodinibius saliphilus]
MAKTTLKKQLRLFDIFAISTGAMFSSGFFLLPGLAAAQTGPSVYLAYLASGLLILPAMLSVAELSTAMPKAGGAYYFLDRSLGPLVGTVGGLGSWIALMFKSSFALIGMGAYLSLYLDISFTLLALVLTVIFGILNVFGAKETTMLQRVLVTILVVIMGIFVIQGLTAVPAFKLSGGIDSYGDFFRNDLHGFVATIGLVFVSYAGLTKVASVAEEVQNPDRNIPLGMGLSLITAILIYVLGVYIMLSVLEPGEFYKSLTPVVDAGEQFLSWLPGSWGVIAMVVAAVAAFASTGNAGIMSASRYPFAMARDKLVSPAFGRVGKTGTPTVAIMVTVVCMIVILLTFDVQAVAKLASAFQLLLFGLLCFAVIVMRESKIAAYSPGFKSPFYPWVQIAGMLISVWLIAEMGLLAVSFTGVISVFCVAWYYYYVDKNVQRQGAIFHVHERLGRKRYEALEHELLSIVNEKNAPKRLSYEEIVARSVIIDIEDEDKELDELTKDAAEIFAERVILDNETISGELTKRSEYQLSSLGNGVVSCYVSLPEVSTAEMVVYRLPAGYELLLNGKNTGVHAIIFLITPQNEPGLDLRVIGHVAEIIQVDTFNTRWKEASTEKELREVLMSDEHFSHVFVDHNPYFRDKIGQNIRSLSLPGECLVAIIYRHGELVIPHGHTKLEPGDELSVIGEPEDIKQLMSG